MIMMQCKIYFIKKVKKKGHAFKKLQFQGNFKPSQNHNGLIKCEQFFMVITEDVYIKGLVLSEQSLFRLKLEANKSLTRSPCK